MNKHISKFSLLFCRSCRNTSFHLATPSSPVLMGKNEEIVFNPYYTSYPGLIDDMTSCGIPPEPNMWNEPILLGNFVIFFIC